MDPILFVSTILAILAVIGSIVYAKRYISAQDVRGQLAAKDAIINTNQQTIESFETRMTQLEKQLSQVTEELARARATVEGLRREISELRRYTAPEAIKRFEKRVDEIHAAVVHR